MTQSTVPLSQARAGDLVDLGDRGIATVLSIAPSGAIFLQPAGYIGPKHIFTINPSLPATLPFTHPHTVHS